MAVDNAGEARAVPTSAADVDASAVLARVAERERKREPVVACIAAQAEWRAGEVAEWTLDRSWPAGRLREAWVVARYGPRGAADYGAAAAGGIAPGEVARARRAVARYERYSHVRPDELPVGGLAALMALAAAGAGRSLADTVRQLDQLTRRMRAAASAGDPRRPARQARRAHRRRSPSAAGRLVFRLPGPRWPSWIATDGHGKPQFDACCRLIVVRDRPVPPTTSTAYRLTVLDAYLCAGLRPPLDVDGPLQMHLRAIAHEPPDPYLERRAQRTDGDGLELTRVAGITDMAIRRMSPEMRAALLAKCRTEAAWRARREHQAFIARLLGLDDQS
jgi:hypothetical protein